MSEVPSDLRYTAEHEWIRVDGDEAVIGVTDYAQDALTDVVWVELPEVGMSVGAMESCGSVESVKSVSEIYAPIAGEVTEANESLEDAPEQINQDILDSKYIFFSHGHPDHLNPDSIHKFKNNTIILGDHVGKRMFNDLKSQGFNVRILKERVWNELVRIINGANASIVLSRMNDDGVLPAIIGFPLPKEIFAKLAKLPADLEARMTILFSGLKTDDVTIILERLKVPKAVFSRVKFLHFLTQNSPKQTDLRLYRNTLGKEVNTHSVLVETLGGDNDLINKALQYPTGIECLVNGEWIMERTGLEPGIKLGRLKDWLFRIQIERGYTDLSQMETALCTIPWANGDPKEWPRPSWP